MSGSDFTSVKLRNGLVMPSVGFGCAFGNWTDKSKFLGFLPEEAHSAIYNAVEAGYKHFDIAHFYRTESMLGRQLAKAFEQGMKRDEVWITTKLAHSPPDPEGNFDPFRSIDLLAGNYSTDAPLTEEEEKEIATKVRKHYMQSLDDVGLGYFDLVLMHWPAPLASKDTPSNRARARRGRFIVWNVFCEFLSTGRVKAIGTSNFNARHLQELLDDIKNAKAGEPPQWHPSIAEGGKRPRKYDLVAPHVNQIEYHPQCQQVTIADFCKKHDIAVTCYAPLGSGALGTMEKPEAVEVAKEVSKAAGEEVTTGQVLLLWLLQQGFIIIPKSQNRGRMAANLRLIAEASVPSGDGKFEKKGPLKVRLTDEQMAKISSIGGDKIERTCPSPDDLP